MPSVLNTLYVTVQGAYLKKEHERVVIELPENDARRIPLLHLDSMVLFGRVMVSPALMRWCGENGCAISFLSRTGQFRARLIGPRSGNVLLRLQQFELAADPDRALPLARNMVAGKIKNARHNLLRSRRDTDIEEDRQALQAAADRLAQSLRALPRRQNLDEVRGTEGIAARQYFAALPHMIRVDREALPFQGRVRRPPTDPVNSLLSYLYAILMHDCAAAAESTGLDPQVGFLHAPRPGRPSLALDLMEELRPVLADRVALTLLNRQQLQPGDFEKREGGAVHIRDEARKTILRAYQGRKNDEVQHPVLDRKVSFGLLPHLQARLLARTIRGDLDGYPPFLYR